MSAFSEAALEKKLSELSNSQQSVQTLSLWLIHHRKHSRTIVGVWFNELKKGESAMASCSASAPASVLHHTSRLTRAAVVGPRWSKCCQVSPASVPDAAAALTAFALQLLLTLANFWALLACDVLAPAEANVKTLHESLRLDVLDTRAFQTAARSR